MNLLLKVATIVRWVAGAFIVLMGIAGFFTGSYISGAMMIGLGLLLIPLISAFLKSFSVRFLRSGLAIAAFAIFVIGTVVQPGEASKVTTTSGTPRPEATISRPATTVTPLPTPTPTPTLAPTSPTPTSKPAQKLVTSTPIPKTVATPAPASQSVYYANCTVARAAGVTPLYRGQPGYRSPLDRDNDGVACE